MCSDPALGVIGAEGGLRGGSGGEWRAKGRGSVLE